MENSGRAIVCIVSFFRLNRRGPPSPKEGPERTDQDVSPTDPHAHVWIGAAQIVAVGRKGKPWSATGLAHWLGLLGRPHVIAGGCPRSVGSKTGMLAAGRGIPGPGALAPFCAPPDSPPHR